MEIHLLRELGGMGPLKMIGPAGRSVRRGVVGGTITIMLSRFASCCYSTLGNWLISPCYLSHCLSILRNELSERTELPEWLRVGEGE